MTNTVEFVKFPKIARYSREITVTEKIDGTNASIFIGENGAFLTGSKNSWITPEDDNYGFSRWAHGHKDELMCMGPGRHFGEWWGNSINRGYGLPNGDRRFSLFNVDRWCLHDASPAVRHMADPTITKLQDKLPACVGLVPKIWCGLFDDFHAEIVIGYLRQHGSLAVPGFMRPEGIVIWHSAGDVCFKKTLEHDAVPKSKVKHGKEV